MSHIGLRIREVRLALKQSQSQFADHLGVSTGFLGALETGDRLPGAKAFSSLARLGVSMDWLIHGKGSMWLIDQSVPESTQIRAEEAALRRIAHDMSEPQLNLLLDTATKLLGLEKKVLTSAYAR